MKRLLVILLSVTLLLALGLTGASCTPELEPVPEPSPTPSPTPEPVPMPSPEPTPSPAPEPAPAPAEKTGTMEFLVTDAPAREEVTSIVFTASQLQIHQAVAEQEQQQNQSETSPLQEQEQLKQGGGEWLTIDLAPEASTFDLLKIKGIEALFATSEVTAGKYTQVRLVIDKVEVALNGGALQLATLPSGELKFVRPFDIVAGEKTSILLDFDAAKSVNITGKGDIKVKPVVKLTVKNGGPSDPVEGMTEVTIEESQNVAEDFVKNSPTYAFDGMEDTLELTATTDLSTPYGWQFTYEFQSLQAGYGDRTDQMMAEVITPHEAVVTVIQGEVTEAVMDGTWDMLAQQELNTAPPETVETITIDSAYNGQEIELSAGNMLSIVLDANPTTGFRWELTEISDASVLEVTGNSYEQGEQGTSNPPVVGAGGQETWTFNALAAGTATLSMEYSRPWEGGEKAVETFEVTVNVS